MGDHRHLRAMLAVAFAVFITSGSCRTAYIDCIPEGKGSANKTKCGQRKCVWLDERKSCVFPNNTGYKLHQKDNEDRILKKSEKGGQNPYGTDMDIRMKIERLGCTLHIRIGDVEGSRFDTLRYVDFPQIPSSSSEEFSFDEHLDEIYWFAVVRKSTGTRIWDTSIGGLLFSDQYIQIATLLPTDKIYGFGEHARMKFKHDFTKDKTWAMFPRNEPPDPTSEHGKNLYGVHGFYLGLEADNRAHGVLILNSNAQEITTTRDRALIYRTIGGILHLYFFPGPRPEDVIIQYECLIGRPFLPPYFALGFQLSRFGYIELKHMKNVVDQVRTAKIPLDVPYLDIDHTDRYNSFSIGKHWKELRNYTRWLLHEGMHFFPIFDVAVNVVTQQFKNAIRKNASFIEWDMLSDVPQEIQSKYDNIKETKIMLGVAMQDNHTAFPDFFDQKTRDWWITELQNFFLNHLRFDGVWLNKNEPNVFGTNEDHPDYFNNPDHPKITPLKCPTRKGVDKFEDPPFKTANAYFHGPNARLSANTLCLSGRSERGESRFYDTKTLYGLAHARTAYEALKKTSMNRSPILTKSTFPSSGRYSGHWTGDNSARWEHLKATLIAVLEFNMFGIPNHNDKYASPQHPTVWPSVANATRSALLFRYRFMPYLYSLHFEASLNGGTVIRPMFFEFPEDNGTHELDQQFMWGPSIMVIPVVDEGVKKVSGYLPSGRWFSLRERDFGRNIVVPTSRMQEFSAKTNELIPVLMRGGHIVMRQEAKLTLGETRRTEFDMLIALDDHEEANGKFYWDGTDERLTSFDRYPYNTWYFKFTIVNSIAQLQLNLSRNTQPAKFTPHLRSIEILGYTNPNVPNNVVMNKKLTRGLHLELIKNRLHIRISREAGDISKRNISIWWGMNNAEDEEMIKYTKEPSDLTNPTNPPTTIKTTRKTTTRDYGPDYDFEEYSALSEQDKILWKPPSQNKKFSTSSPTSEWENTTDNKGTTSSVQALGITLLCCLNIVVDLMYGC